MKFFQQRKKKIDYRIQLLRVFTTTLKACKLFLIQKTVKKLRKTQKKGLEELLGRLKRVNSNELKLFGVFLIKGLNVDINKVSAELERQVPGYQQKLDGLTEEQKSLLSELQTIKKFNDCREEVERILGNVKKRIEKTKDSRRLLKEKHRKKRMKIADSLMAEEALEKGSKPEPNEKIAKKADGKKRLKIQKTENFKEKKINKRYENKKKVRSDPNEVQEEPVKREQKPIQKDFLLTTDYVGLHPSWQARIDLKAQEKSLPFLGTRKKLI